MDALKRRTFVLGGAGAAFMLAFGGVMKLTAGSALLLRPPGGQEEEHLLATCIKCDRCRSVCPRGAIGVANLNDGLLNARTPKLDYHLGYCDFCNLCIDCCPTGALLPFDPEKEWIGPAVIETSLCIAFQPEGGGCKRCIEGCPYDAITTDSQGRPVVETEKCNGCGYCEYICPSNSYRVFSGTRKRAITVEAQGSVREAKAAAVNGAQSGEQK